MSFAYMEINIEDVFGDLSNDYESNLEILDIKKEKYKSHPRYNNLLDKILIKEKYGTKFAKHRSRNFFIAGKMVFDYTDC